MSAQVHAALQPATALQRVVEGERRVEELDGVAYVGDAALKKLLAWALAHPQVKAETVEGVAFTSAQVSAVVWGVNQTTSDELDDALGLETRAASNLLMKAPYTSIAQMGACCLPMI